MTYINVSDYFGAIAFNSPAVRREEWMQQIVALGRLMLSNARDLLPIVVIIALFQGAVIRVPIPQLGEVLVGLGFVLVGPTLFVRGLAMSLFVLGQDLADAIARRGNLAMLLLFAFALGSARPLRSRHCFRRHRMEAGFDIY